MPSRDGGQPAADNRAKRFRARTAIGYAVTALSAICLLAAVGAFIWSRNLGGAIEAEGAEVSPQSLLVAAIILLCIGIALPLVLLFIQGRRKEWERVLDLILSQRRNFRLMLIGSAVLVVSELSVPIMLKFVLDNVVNQQRDLGLFIIFMVVILGLVIIRGAAGFLRTYNAQSLSYRIATDLRNRLYSHLQGMSYSYFDRSRQGELMSKVTNDVVVLQNFIMNSSEDFFVAPLKVIGGVALVFYLNWQLALVVMATAVITALLLKVTGGRLRRINREVQEQLGTLTAQLAEGINTIRLAQSFGLERKELSKFTQTNNDALRKITAHIKISAFLLPTIEILGFAAPLIIIGVLSYEAISTNTSLRIGELLAIGGYGALVANPLGKLSRLLVTLAMGEAASARIFSILETKPDIIDLPGAVDIDSCDGMLEFSKVNLRYSDKDPYVLNDVDLLIPPGEVVAIVGESGSGKSSLLHLVPRFYDISGGSVQLDGRDIRHISVSSLRKQIGIVSQETILVHGTVRENIAYGNPGVDEKDILDAAQSANAHNFIMEFPDGYDTEVGEMGVTLSGGQRQRIAIARVLLRDPRILLLDEATSALDSISEALVQDALNKLMYGRTTMLVAHRLSTVQKADRIIVMKQGRIVEQGTHSELLTIKGGEYARLVKLQGLQT